MEIKSLVLKENKVEIKIFSDSDTNFKTGQILELNFNDDIWYFKIKEVLISAIDITKPYSLVTAETYGNYRRIAYLINKTYDFGKMIGIEPNIVNDENLLKELKKDLGNL